ncbi:MAG: D-lyxose/D-mannose family sugar isomerase [Pedobacter sp.]|nr:MAG: D-lyxose/D-mannose family sugar isomerase [Pedobacter sp.]
MKRSEINRALAEATAYFSENGWVLPPNPKWDITDFGLGDFNACGLVLVNLAEEEEYCEKIMYAKANQSTPAHTHRNKKEDIICRTGVLAINLWANDPSLGVSNQEIPIKINGIKTKVVSNTRIDLSAGERITILPGVWHAFYPLTASCMIGEVSTSNDDVNDNFFSDPRIGRFAEIIEDEEATVKLLGE